MAVDCSRYPTLSAKYLNMRRLAIFLFVVCVGTTFGSVSTVPVISEFDPDQRQIFTGPDDDTGGDSYFHYISFDPRDSSRIYIGALDFVYRLNADNISFNSSQSENITNAAGFQPMLEYSLAACREPLAAKPNPDYQCRSHVRAVLPIDGELYVCATGYYNPQDFYLDRETLRVVAVGNNANDPVGAGSGVSKCPQDPDSLYTILSVEQSSPRLLPAIYSALLISSGYDPAIYRSSLRKNRTSSVEFYQLRSQRFANADVTFVATYEIGQFVYFFYSEIAAEVSSCGGTRYSRVARVCKNDLGGGVESNRFLTFIKARLVCSVGSGGDIPIYYDELYDVQYDAKENVFYGLFRMNRNSSWGSAVCRFSYKSIADKFEKDQFLSQNTASSPWTVTPDDQGPTPRLCLCQTNVTTSLDQSAQIFGLTHYLMAGGIDPTDGGPLYYNKDVGYSQLVVDAVQGFDQNFTVFLLFSEKRPDEIVRVVQWTTDGVVSSKQFSVLKPFLEDESHLWNMVLHKSSNKNWVYVVKDRAVIQLSTVLCSQYKLCTDCVTDPYCGWNSTSHVCLPYKRGLLQNVASRSSLTACNAVCKISTLHRQPFIPGLTVHLNSSSRCSPEGSVTWSWVGQYSRLQLWPSQKSDENYILTQNGGLVILNFTSSLAGTIRCESNGVTLAEHTIEASCCNYSDDVYQTFIKEYKRWCDAFTEYKKEYTNWICSKNGTGTSTTSPRCKDYCTGN